MTELVKGKEGQAVFYYYKGNISTKLPVFYNPVMVVNRDLTNLFIREININTEVKGWKPIKKAVSLMAGTGVREIRWKKELNLKEIIANDLNPKAIELIKKNSELNNIDLIITQKDARFYDELADFIDLDPFGSPLPFLQPLIKGRYFKVTATDLAVFCSYKNKCLLKYRDFPKNRNLCHVEAIKILAKRVRDFLRMHELNAEPIFSYYYKHHITVFFKKTRKWKETDENLKIYDYEFLNRINIKDYKKLHKEDKVIASKETLKLIELIKNEAFDGYYYYLPEIYSKYKIQPIAVNKIIEKSQEIGIKTTKTHFDSEIIKSEMQEEEFVKFLRKINKK